MVGVAAANGAPIERGPAVDEKGPAVNLAAKAPSFWHGHPGLVHDEISAYGQHGDITRQVFELAAGEGVPAAVAADRLAERRMNEIGRLRGMWLPR